MRDRTGNNFDTLRLVAALFVWYSHCYSLKGELYKISSFQTIGAFGLIGFFFISGYLITESYLRHNNLRTYFKNRSLRIIPAFYTCLIVTFLIFGPLATSLSLKDYFTNPKSWSYFLSMLFFPTQYYLPDVFNENPIHKVNASIWTLPAEITCYTIIGALGYLKILSLKSALFLISLSIFMMAMGHVAFPQVENFFDIYWPARKFFPHIYFVFFLGSAFYFSKKYIPVRVDLFVLALVGMYFSLDLNPLPGTLLLDVCVVYAYYFIALGKPIFNLGRWGDFSYGTYLYSYPIQQLTLHYLGKDVSMPVFMAISLSIALLFAIISWFLIEKPFLKFKNAKLQKNNPIMASRLR